MTQENLDLTPPVRWVLLVTVLVLLCFVSQPKVLAQENPSSVSSESPANQESAEANAQSSEAVFDSSGTNSQSGETKKPDMVPIGVTPAGVQRNVSERWTTLAVNGTNTLDEDREETIIVSLDNDDSLQFARKLWVPAGSRRQAWLPIRIPKQDDPEKIQITGQVIQLAESDSGESYQANRVGSPTSKRSLLLSPPEDEQAAVMLDPVISGRMGEATTKSITEMLYAGYDTATNTRQDLGMTRLSGHFLPPTANPLDSLDELIIANDRLLHDTVGVSRLRSWLMTGGRVWIMADRVSPDSVRALLGDSVSFGLVDRVPLNNFSHEQLDPFFATISLEEAWQSETPVEMARVLTDATEVFSEIDGWPSAFWVSVGEGEVLVTTLGHQGWMQNGAPTALYSSLASRFFIKRSKSTTHADRLAKELDREIGYTIPSRTLISFLLGGQLLFLGLAGSWMLKRRQLHQLVFVLPASIACTVLALLIIGLSNNSAIPSTIATGQVARANPKTSQVEIETITAVYSQSEAALPINSTSDTITWPGKGMESGESRRLQWSDSGQAEWKRLQQPPGKVQHFRSVTRRNAQKPWQVSGSFDENGFVGKLVGIDIQNASDAVIVSAALPSMSVVMDPAQNLVRSTAESVLMPDQFYDGALLTEIQRNRQELIRDLARNDDSLKPEHPSMLLWSPPIEDLVQFPTNYTRRGWTLILCPIAIEPLETGKQFVVPAGFVKLETYRGSRGISTLYNSESGKWLESVDKPADIDLRVQLPVSVVPCDVTRCDIEFQMTAPGRTVTFYGIVDETRIKLYEETNPRGLVDFSIQDTSVLQLDKRGGFLITVSVSETEQERAKREDDTPSNALPTEQETEAIVTNVDDSSTITWAIQNAQFHVHATAE